MEEASYISLFKKFYKLKSENKVKNLPDFFRKYKPNTTFEAAKTAQYRLKKSGKLEKIINKFETNKLTNKKNALSKKQKLFVDEYIKDFNGARAARAAGYSKKTARIIANQLLTKLDIREEIQSVLHKREKRTQITQDMAVNELSLIGFARFSDIATWDANGRVSIKSSKTMNERGKAAIKSIKYRETSTENGTNIELEINLWDKRSPLIELLKHTAVPFHIVDKIDKKTEECSLDIFQQIKLYEDLGYQPPKHLVLKAQLSKSAEEDDFDFLGDLDNEEFERELIAKKKAENIAEREAELEIRKQELRDLDKKEDLEAS
jgi:phage terminase small subunit